MDPLLNESDSCSTDHVSGNKRMKLGLYLYVAEVIFSMLASGATSVPHRTVLLDVGLDTMPQCSL